MNTLQQPVVLQRPPPVFYHNPGATKQRVQQRVQQVIVPRQQLGQRPPVQYVQPMVIQQHAQPQLVHPRHVHPQHVHPQHVHIQPQKVPVKKVNADLVLSSQNQPVSATSQGANRAHIPLAKCRVLYLGSSVPLETAQGLDAVQLPLKERYPFENKGDVPGIDAWLTVYSSGLMLQYVNDKSAKTWFPIQTLHVCAAVKCIVQMDGSTGDKTPKFVALDSDAAKGSRHPPMFACIMRRTKGVKVLECHVFISKSNQAAMALVQSATHAYEHKEGWTDDRPEPEDENNTHTRLIPADPPPKVTAPPEFFKAPPEQGYFYATNKELVKNYNVMGGRKDAENEQDKESHHEREGSMIHEHHTYAPQKAGGTYQKPIYEHHNVNPGAVPYAQVPGFVAPFMPNVPLMPVAPPGYFADWNTYQGRPIAIMGEPPQLPAGRVPYHHQHHQNNRSISPPRPRETKEYRRRHSPQRHHHVSDYSSTIDHYGGGHRPSTPPADYERGDSSDMYDRKANSDLIMYADNYQHYNHGAERDTKQGDHNSNFSPEIFMRENQGRDRGRDEPATRDYDDQDALDNFDPYNGNYEKELPERSDDRRFPMQTREFSNSMMEERNVVGDYAAHPNAYKMNIGDRERDNESQIDYDIFHRREQDMGPGGFDNLENTLGYFP